MKEVMITVSTVQTDDTQSDRMELTVEGRYAEKDGVYLIQYVDAMLTGVDQPVKTTLKITADDVVTVTRSGPFQNRFTLEEGKRCNSLYATPYGTINMGFFAEAVQNRLGENGGQLKLVYAVDINHQQLNRNEMTVQVAPRI